MKKIVILFLLIFTFLFVEAQNEEVPLPKSLQIHSNKNTKKDNERKIKFLAGGNLGVQFGNYTAVEIAPQVGIYPAVDWLLIGVGGTYMYAWNSYYKISNHTFGFDAFVQAYPWNWLILHGSYEYLNYPIYNDNDKSMARSDLNSVLVGAGYRQYISEKVSVYGLLLFNVYQSKSYYTRDFIPTVKAGINVDL